MTRPIVSTEGEECGSGCALSLGDEELGIYAEPQHEVNDLTGGKKYVLVLGLDTGALGISGDLTKWERRSP